MSQQRRSENGFTQSALKILKRIDKPIEDFYFLLLGLVIIYLEPFCTTRRCSSPVWRESPSSRCSTTTEYFLASKSTRDYSLYLGHFLWRPGENITHNTIRSRLQCQLLMFIPVNLLLIIKNVLHRCCRCTGLDGLVERAAKYYAQGARFAKWRAVLQITDDGGPSELSLQENAWGLARYARSVQESGTYGVCELTCDIY